MKGNSFYNIRRGIAQTVALIVLSSSVQQLYAQNESDEAVVTSIANSIMKNTSYKFVDAKTKTSYDSPAQFPAEGDMRTQSLYNKWEYANGVMMIGMQKAAKYLNKKEYADYARKNFEFVFQNESVFRKNYATNKGAEWAGFFRMGSLDDCGAMAAALSDVNETAKNKQFEKYINDAANYISAKQSRLSDHTFSRTFPHNMTIWADDLYMSVPFLARMGERTGDKKYFDDAINQILNFNKYLYDPSTNLFFHCWYQDVAQNGVAHWLRCNGWLAMAQVELLEHLPASHPRRAELISCLLRQIAGVSRYQDQSGLWHQLIDRPDSYLETSGTAMFVYAIAKAVNEKWIPASYRTIAIDGWNGLTRRIMPDGKIEDVCIGTNIADNIAFYYNRPKVLNDFHALGPVLLAGTEVMRLKTNYGL